MQKVVKVSISNIAFTLEQDAHELMQDYLERLQIHYESSPNCGEILSEIESRIAELLSERGYRDKVVPPETVQEIIGILGRPEDFDGESEDEHRTTKKRVYRDPDNKIVGGVCGLGMFAYIVLWIAMPEARTVEQRYNMKGGSVSLKDIQKSMRREAGDAGRRVGKGVRDGVRSTGGFWKAMGRCIVICTGILLLLIGMSGSVAGLMAMFGIGIWNSVNAFGLSWMLSILTDTPVWASVLITVLACIVAVLPFIGALYAGILMLFRLKSPKWRPGLIMFIVWAAALLGLIGTSLGSLSTIRSIDHKAAKAQLPTLDTLYIEFAGCTQWKDCDVLIDADNSSFDLMYMDKKDDRSLLVVYPDLYIGRNSDTVGHISAYTEYVTEGMTLNDITEKKSRDFWSFDEQTRTLRLEPIVFSSDVRATDIERDIHLAVNKKTRVIVREPVNHEFDSHIDFCSSRFLKMISEM